MTAQSERLYEPGRGRFGLLADRPFRNLWLASWLSLLGSQISRIGLILYLFEQRDSVAGLALLVVLETLPGALVAPLAGTLIDRVNKRAVMILADLVRVVLLGAILVHPAPSVIYVVAAFHSIASAFFGPAKAAAIPLVVSRKRLPAANALDQGMANGVLVVGPIVGAEMLLGLGLHATLTVDILSYLASALFLVRVPIRQVQTPVEQRGSTMAETRSGWSYVAGHVLVLQLTLLFFISLVCTGLWVPLAPFFIRDFLGASERILGWQIAVTGLGTIAGAVAAPWLIRRYGKGHLLFAALLAEGVVMALYSQMPSLAASMLLMVAWGIAVSMIVVPFYSILQTVVEERFLGRVFSLVRQSENVALLGAMGVAMVLQAELPAQGILFAAGVVYIGLTAVLRFTRGGRVLVATR